MLITVDGSCNRNIGITTTVSLKEKYLVIWTTFILIKTSDCYKQRLLVTLELC